jgi:hypothetical protein
MNDNTLRQESPAEVLLRKSQDQYATISASLKLAETNIRRGDQDEAKRIAARLLTVSFSVADDTV